MPTPPDPRLEHLKRALPLMARHPIRTIVPPWSWKAATFSALVRALTFFVLNLRNGRSEATKAMLIEAVFATFAAGLLGAISQQLREAKPLWATALLVWLGLPAAMLLAQFGVHRLAGTPHLSGGIVVSFCLASIASAFSWYAMRHGAMLGGVDETPVVQDVKTLPGIALDFVLAGPRMLWGFFHGKNRAASRGQRRS